MMRTANAEPMTVGTTSYVPLSEIDFDNEDVDELPLGRDPVVGVILAVGSLYVLFALWAWREDQKDKYKVGNYMFIYKTSLDHFVLFCGYMILGDIIEI
ncbi:hypothetical protein DPMN_024184 [Dreissena polymorpha]|uniref:Uncharacterized protein n=1 Tax=Dreissena polymorpha TaxID=45954 RepID=A0A9D4RC28_DREPO|nr:hypothetical protein DPMN_024184 [Dreissena polymorpha]